MHFKTPNEDEKDAYTRVLLGNLDLERTIWPKKSSFSKVITGEDLDIIARRHLWMVFLYK